MVKNTSGGSKHKSAMERSYDLTMQTPTSGERDAAVTPDVIAVTRPEDDRSPGANKYINLRYLTILLTVNRQHNNLSN